MKRAKRMQAFGEQCYDRQVLKGLRDLDRGRVVSLEDVSAHLDLTIAIAEAKHASGALVFKRRARSWWKSDLASLEEDDDES
ncbi:MAG: hypothetical protein FD187_1765 [bacterium]|nr:MAG: hypothetical protein FD142_734 [bacterium]KAF0148719.1 MAG: hypothetical protein FD187_1765 [bacterium]KAF0168209.1 MAG: hypothetical protein FD158_1602 [bacterium]TXT18732.1 MAG: hypothetical protein FD132_2006 [bacterium]